MPALANTLLGLTALLLAGYAGNSLAQTSERSRPQTPIPGTFYQSAATQALQADDGANPAMLWVGQGEILWTEPAGPEQRSCASCHGDAAGMKGVATQFPKIDAASGTLLNLEARINQCRTQHQKAPAFAYETAPLLSLTAFLALQSRGLPRNVAIDGAAKNAFERGRLFFNTRQGQLNLACAQCHDDNVGRKLRGDTISQGQTQGWPAYRFEWQSIGSLHRRLRACSLGVRAEIRPYGSPEYVDLELYLAWRSKDLPLESPAVRR